jgi:ABC-type polysaccharide/polyol phosphate export permease
MSSLESSLAVVPIAGAVDGAPRTPERARPAAAPAPTRNPSAVRVLGPNERVALGSEMREIWERRDLLLQLAARDVRIRYKQAVMGFAWAVLMPVLIVGAGTVFRLAVVTMTGARFERAEIGSVILKSFPWAFFSGAIGFAVNSITGSISLVTKIYFPRAILPIATVAANMFDLAVGVVAITLLLPFFGGQLTWALLWVPALVALLVLFTTGLGAVLACANLFFRDVKYITQVALTFGIFFTPVLFDASAFGARGSRLLMLNPLGPIFEGLQLAVIRGHNLLEPLATTTRAGVTFTAWQPWYLLYSVAWAVLSVVAGIHLFRRTQDLFAEFA